MTKQSPSINLMVFKGKKGESKGFTLPELIFCVAAISFLAIALPRFFIEFEKAAMASSSNINSQENAVTAAFLINSIVRKATASSITLAQKTGETPFSELTFKDIQGNYFEIYKSGNDLIFNDGQPRTLLKRSIKSLSFSYPDITVPTTLQVSVTTTDTVPNRPNKFLSTAIKIIHLENS